MRITGGQWKGRQLETPKTGALRPTQDRVREALFSMLRVETPGAKFLDLFAGSGAVGLEALSRGAAHSTFVEAEKAHCAAIAKNIRTLGVNPASARVVATDAFQAFGLEPPCAGASSNKASRRGAPAAGYAALADSLFDIIYADPPYALLAQTGFGTFLEAAAKSRILRPGGIFIAEMPDDAADPVSLPGWNLCRDRRYGQSRIAVWSFAG